MSWPEPYIYTVYLIISLPEIPYIHRIHMVLAYPTNTITCVSVSWNRYTINNLITVGWLLCLLWKEQNTGWNHYILGFFNKTRLALMPLRTPFWIKLLPVWTWLPFNCRNTLARNQVKMPHRPNDCSLTFKLLNKLQVNSNVCVCVCVCVCVWVCVWVCWAFSRRIAEAA